MKQRVWVVLCLCALPLCQQARGQDASSSAPAEPGIAAPRISSACRDLLGQIEKLSKNDPNLDIAIADALKIGLSAPCFAALAAESPSLKSAVQKAERPSYSNFLKTLENQRTDKQAGSSTGTGGTTNLVSKGVTAQALSVAAEYGALTESVSSKVLTVQGSLDGLAAAAVRQKLFAYCPDGTINVNGGDCVHKNVLRFLRRISYGISFNPNLGTQQLSGTASGMPTGTTQPVTFAASGSEISSATAKVVLWNDRNTTSNAFKTAWTDALSPGSRNSGNSSTAHCTGKGAPTDKPSTGKGAGTSSDSSNSSGPSLLDAAATSLAASLMSLVKALNVESSKEYSDWFTDAAKALKEAKNRDATDSELEEAWITQELLFVDLAEKLDPNLAQHVADLLQTTARYEFEEEEFVSCIADQPLMTAEYDYNQPVGQIATSTIRFIFDKGIGKNFSLTANGAVALYDSQPSGSIPGARRLRDVQAGLEGDWKFGALALVGAPVLSGTYYFQDQTSPAILNVNPSMPIMGITLTGLPSNATQVFAKKGNISIGQLKLTLGSGKSSVRVPFAISYSNRTELITRPEWKAQIGLTYDFDSLFTSSGSSKANP